MNMENNYPHNVYPIRPELDPEFMRLVEIASADIDKLAEALPEEERQAHEEAQRSIVEARRNPLGEPRYSKPGKPHKSD